MDPWQLLSALREKNLYNGVQYVKAKVEKCPFTYAPCVKRLS